MGCVRWGFQSTFRDNKFCGKSSLITLQNYYCWGQIYGCTWTLGRTLCCSQSTLLMLLGVFILACWCGCVCQSAFIFLHPNWCRWKILSTHLKPSGKSLWCLIRSHTDICLNCLVQSLPKLIKRNRKEVCMRKYIGDGWADIAVVRGVSGGSTRCSTRPQLWSVKVFSPKRGFLWYNGQILGSADISLVDLLTGICLSRN